MLKVYIRTYSKDLQTSIYENTVISRINGRGTTEVKHNSKEKHICQTTSALKKI